MANCDTIKSGQSPDGKGPEGSPLQDAPPQTLLSGDSADRRSSTAARQLLSEPAWLVVRRHGLPLGILLVAFLFVYGHTIIALVQAWSQNADYAHGFLVIPMVGYVVWKRRDRLARSRPQASGSGLILLTVALVLHLVGVLGFYRILPRVSLILAIVAVVLLLCGKRVAREAAPVLLLLLFMIPIPARLESFLSAPLQQCATQASAYMLQTFGLPAVTQGNVVWVEDFQINVVRACSGLKMLMSFGCISLFVFLLVDRPWWDRLAILAAAVPIALLVNIGRIVAAGLLLPALGGETARQFLHDVSGYLMMPLALVLLLLGLRLSSWLVICTEVRPQM